MRTFLKKYIGALFITQRLYAAIICCTALFVLRFFFTWLGDIPFLAVLILLIAAVYDYMLLFYKSKGIFAARNLADRLSNGDENEIRIDVENFYNFAVLLEIIDEVPHQFQKRDVLFKLNMGAGYKKVLRYKLRPVKRGIYEFGVINIYVKTVYGLFSRRYIVGVPAEVPVYPSYLQLRKYQLMAMSNRLSEVGVKKVRRIGQSMEFEQIKEYVAGDDYRTVNWKATARKSSLMVNNYTDEKSQQLYCVIDKSRVMKMPFEELSLLDYAINASLVLCNIALTKMDKAGLLTFSENIGSFLPADKKALQMQSILETLYNQKTRYLESDYERLYIFIRRRITQRSLILLFTNFESLTGMRRQLPYLKKIAENHLLIAIFFENTELAKFISKPSENLEEVYSKTVAENFAFEKRQIVKELNQSGILTILTAPQNLTVNALNKYLEIKARGML